MRTVIAFLLLGFVSSAMGATYYIDYASGSDSNSGTDSSHAWKYCPGMQPFSGSYSHSAGDRFIFRGGVTWPNAALPLYIKNGGTSVSRDYYGTSSDYYTGGSWTRPVFDAGGSPLSNWSSLSYPGTLGDVIFLDGIDASAGYITIEGIEIKNHVYNNPWTTTQMEGFGVFSMQCSGIMLTNLYIHDWVVEDGHDTKYGGIGAYNSTVAAWNCTIVAPATVAYLVGGGWGNGHCSGAGTFQIGTVEGCTIVGTTQGIFSPQTVEHNVIVSGGGSFDANEHPNGIFLFGGATCNGNIISNWQAGVTLFVVPGWAAGNGKDYVYNNVLINNDPTFMDVDTSGDIAGNDAEAYIFNNTIVGGQAVYFVPRANPPLNVVMIENNLIVSDTAGNNLNISAWTANTQVVQSNVVLTVAQSLADGLTPNNHYNPTSSIPGLAGAGVNLSAYLTTDRLDNIQPASGAWTVGASLVANTNTGAPPVVSSIIMNGADVDMSASGLQIFAGSVVQYSCSASDTNGLPLTWQWSYTVNGGPATVVQSGTGAVASVSFNYTAGMAGNTYVWTLLASNGLSSAAASLTVGVEAPPPATSGLTFQAGDGVLTLPFLLNNGSISQLLQTTDPALGGQAVFTFTITNAGSYVIQALVNAPNDANNSFFVNVDAQPVSPGMIWDIPVTSGFEQRIVSWRGNGTDTDNQFVPAVFDLSAGRHQLIIRGREINVQLQSVAILFYWAPRQLHVVPQASP